jgi:D-threo-aldose 1-dehydrogenase
MKLSKLGKTRFSVTPVCLGASALGSFPAQYGYEVGARQAVDTILRVFQGPFNFIDTSNEYGNGGDSERRIGQAIKENGGLPSDFVLATKVDPIPGTTDFSGERIKRSVAESLERLGVDRLQIVHLHDPEKISFSEAMAKGGPVEAMVALRDEGAIEYLGVAGGPIDLMLQYLGAGLFDVCISHNRFTLVDQTASPLMDEARRRGIGFINCAPYGGGMLVKGPVAVPRYCYAPASARTIERVQKMEDACKAHGVPLAAAALQYSIRDDRVASTVVGMSDPARIDQTVRLLETFIPSALWAILEPLAAEGRDGFV